MKFNDFLTKAFPIGDPFKRDELGLIHNTIKYLAVRFSYIFYKLRVSANMLDMIGALLVTPSFYLIFIALETKEISYFLIGFGILAFTIFIDFIDGNMSKMSKFRYAVGNNLDNLCPDLISWTSVIFIGYMTQNDFLSILCAINVVFFITYKVKTKKNISVNDQWLLTFLHSKFSLLSVRVLPSSIFPILCIIYIYKVDLAILASQILVISYALLSCLWVRATLKDNSALND